MAMIRIAAVSVLIGLIGSAVLPGRTNADASSPKVTLLECRSNVQEADGLYVAVSAQLSGALVSLKRFSIDDLGDFPKTARQSAPRVASATGAVVVFWVEDGDPARVFFYIPSDDGGLYLERSLQIRAETGVGRFEVIGIAAAGMVEGVLSSHQKEIAAAQTLPGKAASGKAAPSPKPAEATPTQTDAPPMKTDTPIRNLYIELYAAYSGVLFAKDAFGHSVRPGIGFIVKQYWVFNAQFRLMLPLQFEDEWATLTVSSRTLLVSVQGRFRIKKGGFELRPGVAYTVDFRSFSTSGKRGTTGVASFDAASGFRAVHGICPFVSAALFFQNRFGLFIEGGADIAVNETTYTINLNERPTPLAAPYTVKASVQAGIVIRI